MPNLKSGNFSEGAGMTGAMGQKMEWLTPSLRYLHQPSEMLCPFRKAQIP